MNPDKIYNWLDVAWTKLKKIQDEIRELDKYFMNLFNIWSKEKREEGE